MKLNVVVPTVSECIATECAYNHDGNCCARAITVGHDVDPMCDTFVRTAERCEDQSEPAGVGACKVAACRHNQGLECYAPEIRVGYRHDHPDCLTFEFTDRAETSEERMR